MIDGILREDVSDACGEGSGTRTWELGRYVEEVDLFSGLCGGHGDE